MSRVMLVRLLLVCAILMLAGSAHGAVQPQGGTPGGGPAKRTFMMPSKAKPVRGVIHEVILQPIYRSDFLCSEHFSGQLDYAGDALGTDCMVAGGIDGQSGFLRLFRTNGATNEDWYGWGADVLSPVTGTVVGVIEKPEINVPGTMGRPPAAMLQIRTSSGVMVVLAHLRNFRVGLNQDVKAGEIVGQVGNNGFARAPHIHVGAYVEKTAEPLQIRWDLEAMAKLRN